MNRTLAPLSLLCAAAWIAAGCGKPPVDCPEGEVGSALVEVTGLAETAAPSLTFRGPEGTVEVTGQGEVKDLPTGRYTISAAVVAAPEDRVRRAFAPALQTTQMCVAATGDPAVVGVTYSVIPSSGKLWGVGSAGASPILAVDQGTLSASTTGVTADVAITSTPTTTNVTGAAFDASGNLWIVDRRADQSSIRRFNAGELGDSGPRTPAVDLRGPALAGSPGAQGLAFDEAGNLWVTVSPSNTIVRFTPEQLIQSGQPEPAVVLGGAQSGLVSPAGLAFDGAGNLWVASFGNSRVARYRANRLGASAEAPDLLVEAKTPQPAVTTLGSPKGVAADGSGNVWVSFAGTNVIARFTPEEQDEAGEVVVTPALQLRLPGVALDGLVFDEGYGLWTPYGQDKLARLSVAQLLTGGNNVTPDVVVEGPGIGNRVGLAMYPAAEKLPMIHRLP